VKRIAGVAFASVAALVLVGGCAETNESAKPLKLTVFAAASLKQSFTQLGENFESDNPGTSVEFSFAGSSELVTQLTQGASADVFASADAKNMAKAKDAGLLAGDPVNFASNTLTIAVAPGNPNKITTFGDLTRAGLDVVVCAPQVPCGSATQKVEKATGVDLEPVSEESSVTDVLNKVSSGVADAGLVYVTDVAGSNGKVAGVEFPESKDAVNTYPIAALKGAANADLGRTFVEFVTGGSGRKVLEQAGFGKP
jgi:molybdate transport system substrate-binding protein